jgi:predicted nuclease of predicted toxin-antitoxin system
VRFLVDAQLPPALARLLADRGHVAEHVGDVGLLSSSDSEIARSAITHDAVLITKAEDFADQALLGAPMPIIVWVRVGNTTRQALLDWFDPLLNQLIAMLDSGERLIELR